MRSHDDAHVALLEEGPRSPKTLRASQSRRRKLAAAVAAAATVLLLLASFGASSSTAPIVIQNGQISMHVLPVGAIIQKLLVPDKNGELADVSLGFDEADAGRYTDGTSPYFGAVVGRVANRVANATFSLDGTSYRLARNEGSFPGSLHGGAHGWDKVTWRAQKLSASAVRLTHHSPDGEEGYPGAVRAVVTYELTRAHELVIEMRATADAPTPINMAQHARTQKRGTRPEADRARRLLPVSPAARGAADGRPASQP